MANEFKPVGNPPQGWAVRKKYIDDEGNVFEYGVHKPELKVEVAKTPDSNPFEAIPEPQEGNISMTKSEFDNFMKGIESKIDKKLSERETQLRKEFSESLKKDATVGFSAQELAKAIATAEQYKVGNKVYRDIRDIDPADYDANGAVFTSYGNGYLIVDDIRNGFPVTTPYGRLFKFRFQASKITKIGKVESYSSYCAFKTNSKKEIDWLRKHTRYNIEFFENTNLAISVNAMKAGIASRIYRAISSLDQPQILERAKSYGIPLGGELRIILSELAYKMAEEEFQKEIREAETRTVDAIKENLLQ